MHEHADTGASPAASRAVGVVVVHGIGDQRRGDTAREVLGAIDLVAESPDGEQSETWSGEEGIPTHTVVRRRLAPGGPVTELVVVDAWWDDVVAAEAGLPRRLRTWWWSLRITPLLLGVSAIMAMAAAAAKELQSAPGANTKPRSQRDRAMTLVTIVPPRTWQTMLRMLHAALLRFLVLPLILLVLLLVGPVLLQLADLLWRRLTRSKSSPAGRMLDLSLRLTLGDAWAFVGDPDRRERILQRVRETLEWTRDRCGPVILLGHSQGGAISRAVLARGAPADRLVTIGSGANLLGVLYNTARKPIVSIITWILLLGYPALVATALSRLVQGRLALDLLVGGALFSLLARLAIGPIHFDPSTLRPRVASWWDVSSRYDPVCVGGHLIEEDVHGVEVVNASKLRHVPSEHVAYFRNPAVGEVILAAIASATTGDQVKPPAKATHGACRWHRTLSGYWWWGLPVTLLLTVGVLRLYGWLGDLLQ